VCSYTGATISVSRATITGVILSLFFSKIFDLDIALNCALGGLFSITFGCSFLEPWQALLSGALIFLRGSVLLKILRINDPFRYVPGTRPVGIFGML